ncbi:MAG: ABC-F family ATP-binding cassette domain-containing protein, partial [Deltaproteobacteria bacterium]|nr:ABC-F family ATP-binding cassette domain-containing protein [Deltaproteobacteria bacterium]
MITFDNVTKAYGRQQILVQASFHVSRGDRVGLVGPNGAGKTTLFKLILQEESPDQGSVHRARGLRIGHLPQEVGQVGNEPLLEMVMATVSDLKAIEAELEDIQAALASRPAGQELTALTQRQSLLLERFAHLDGYSLRSRAEKILEGLGFAASDFERPVEALSGGWRMRALLARILLSDPDLILLDEPTNHLDLNSMLWLEDYLESLRATVMIAAHDRTFLNRTVSRIIELEGGRLGLFSGDYDHYAAEKKNQLKHLAAAHRQQQEKIKQLKEFIARNRSRKDRARQVQARLKALDKMELIEPPAEAKELSFSFPPAPRPPAVLVELKGVRLTYGRPRPVFEGLGVKIGREERIALVGPNGAGKSSLLKLLAGQIQPEAGRRVVPSGVKTAFFAQHQTEQLNPHLNVIEELMTVSGQASQTQVRSLLGGFLFQGDDVFKKVSVLSGGEQSRLVLAKLLLSGANLLLLDEPTNHLDIPSRAALEEALLAWPGAICLVSHDRLLIDAVANRIWKKKPDSRVTAYPGNLNDYLTTWRRLKKAGSEEPPAAEPAETKPGKRDSKRRRR